MVIHIIADTKVSLAIFIFFNVILKIVNSVIKSFNSLKSL